MKKQINGARQMFCFAVYKDYSEVLNPLLAKDSNLSNALRKLFDLGCVAYKAIGETPTYQPSLFENMSEEKQTTTTTTLGSSGSFTTTTTTKEKRSRVINGSIPQNSCRYYTTDKGKPVYISFPKQFAVLMYEQGYLYWDMSKFGDYVCIILSKTNPKNQEKIYFNMKRGGEMRLKGRQDTFTKYLGKPKRGGEMWTFGDILKFGEDVVLNLEKSEVATIK